MPQPWCCSHPALPHSLQSCPLSPLPAVGFSPASPQSWRSSVRLQSCPWRHTTMPTYEVLFTTLTPRLSIPAFRSLMKTRGYTGARLELCSFKLPWNFTNKLKDCATVFCPLAAQAWPLLMLKNLLELAFLKACDTSLAVPCVSSVSFFLHFDAFLISLFFFHTL